MSDIHKLITELNKQPTRLSPLRKFLATRELTIESARLDNRIVNSTVGKPPFDTWVVEELIETDGNERAKISYTDEWGKTHRMVLITHGMITESNSSKLNNIQKQVYTSDGSMFEL